MHHSFTEEDEWRAMQDLEWEFPHHQESSNDSETIYSNEWLRVHVDNASGYPLRFENNDGDQYDIVFMP